MQMRKRKEEEEWIREAGIDLMRAERKVFNDSHLVGMDLETALYYMAERDGYDGSL